MEPRNDQPTMPEHLAPAEESLIDLEQYSECRRLAAKLCEVLGDLSNRQDGVVGLSERTRMRELSHGLVVLAKGLEAPLEREKAKRRLQRGSAWHQEKKDARFKLNLRDGKAARSRFPWEPSELSRLSELYLANQHTTREIARALERSELAVMQKLIEFELMDDQTLRLFSLNKKKYWEADLARLAP